MLYNLKTISHLSPLLRHSYKTICFRSIYTTRSCYDNKNNGSPLNSIVDGIDAFRSTLLQNTPLRHITKPTLETIPFTGKADSWYYALREAQDLVKTDSQDRMMDPVKLLGKDVWELKGNIKKLLGSGHPFVKTLAKHYLSGDTERIRPLLVLLMAQANASINGSNMILDAQRRLAEISEMIHISSLLHYDILDDNDNPGNVIGNKMAVLAGDFLLARASLALAQLRNAECIELMATCIANLVEGEVMQVKKRKLVESSDKSDMDYYMEQCYLKSASLIAQSCKSSMVLGGADKEVAKHAYDYGKHMGLALQLMNDVDTFAKQAANVNNPPNINAPVLFAAEEIEELKQILERNFSGAEDIEKTRSFVYQSNGLKRSLSLADTHVQTAIKAINHLPPSTAQEALIQLARNLGR
ncbi:solanesyl pyrophosphate synthase [Halteromyces radiatus]|uniref:solanesyl pyrophosphate synthase n=1 Tax=Halteromyces radiatus TaxID=101107 RepID=UPI002220BD06|nr:solanesyl pyrophosphate synthase [Halteromyces radiatus]KAI8098968.1 solanesyl pyrophosphate synthase [Halteromyces radiatus]